MEEVWKVIEEFSDYMVSDQGNVKSLKRYHGTNERILTPGKNKYGYLQVDLCKNKKPYTKRIHRLVLETFVGINPDKPFCNHKNGIKSDNRLENLEWCTPSENIRHAVKNGLIKKGEESPLFGKQQSEETKRKQSEKMKGKYLGEKNPNYGKRASDETIKLMRENHADVKGENNSNSILTEEKVIKIWKHINEGILTQKEIGEKFGVGNSTISDIKTGRTWKHIKGGD